MKKVILGQAAEISSGLVINRYNIQKKVSNLKKHYLYHQITLKSVENKNIDLTLLEEFQSERKIDERYLLREGDVIMKLTPPYNAALVDFQCENLVVPQYFAIIRPRNNFDPQYITYILNSKNVQKQLHRLVEGGSLQTIKISSLNTVKINQIEIDEQIKYGKLFSLLSQRKELKKRNIELEELLMEDILTNL